MRTARAGSVTLSIVQGSGQHGTSADQPVEDQAGGHADQIQRLAAGSGAPSVGERGELGAGSEVAIVHRADLQRVLTDQPPRSAIRYESNCLGVDQRPDAATVTWHGPAGETSVTADLVIAAEGLRSPLRHSLWPEDPGVRYAGYTSWRGITAEPFELASGGETWGRGERFGCVPLRDGRVYWFATASVPAGPATTDERAEVLRRFGAWHDPIPALTTSAIPGCSGASCGTGRPARYPLRHARAGTGTGVPTRGRPAARRERRLSLRRSTRTVTGSLTRR